MSALVRSELLKVRTTRGWYGYFAAILVLVGLAVAGTVGEASSSDRERLEWQVDLLEAAGVAGLVALILGITMTTAEFRHGTITPTFLATPVRERVVAAKAVTSAMVALAFAALAFAVIAAIAGLWLSLLGVELELADAHAARRAGQIALVVVLMGLLGVAVGTLVHGQVAALVGTLVWIVLGETLLGGLFALLDVDRLAEYLPFSALDAVDGGSGQDQLGFWAGLGVAIAYICGLGALGMQRTRRRDIT